jgi:YHS domain-containing protein
VEPSLKAKAKLLVTDLVCGMQVDPATAAGASEFQSKRYFFCGAGCKRNFDDNPERFA